MAVLLSACMGCSRSATPVHPFLTEPFPDKLSDWHLFTAFSPALQPNQRVIPYDLNTPLFSDYASKYRFVWMPAGTSAAYHEDGVFDFPVGTILAKTFAFPVDGHPDRERSVETRLLVHTQTGWVGLPYIWNDRQTEARLDLAPDPVPIRYTDAAGRRHDFTYFIPNSNECKQCHENNRVMLPIGPKARNLNKDFSYADGAANQLEYWSRIGYLSGAQDAQRAPSVAKWNDASASLDARARAYLDINCAHCHQPGGTAGYTGVDLRFNAGGRPEAKEAGDVRTFGVCKSPNSAGRVGQLTYDLVPGQPDQSILLARMLSVRPKEMMPQIGRSLVHEEGTALIREWIQSLPTESAPCSKNAAHPSADASGPARGL
ncbi:MAG TPA: SO2930 family diheme c-type cytochrome [Candidatus Sulfotelmatobacter sp.]|nr:SO2930 family diheme c-type cytochrome [Candidatus Sulfotelmatobacter sp.]